MPSWFSRVLWCVVQAAAVGGMFWAQIDEPEVQRAPGLMLFFDICIVAFATAVLVNLWDWLRFRVLPLLSGFGGPRRKAEDLTNEADLILGSWGRPAEGAHGRERVGVREEAR